jgi:acyl-CoA reductase-like NAD-dependent aldehyde dehydrogenase
VTETRLLIGGEQVPGAGDPLEVENPYSEETIASVALPSSEQVDAAIASAREAAVFTKDLDSILRCMREIKAGTVWFNDPLTDNDAGPFGGMKQSGLGRELGQKGLEAFQETKHVHIETQIALKEWWYPYGSGPDQHGH